MNRLVFCGLRRMPPGRLLPQLCGALIVMSVAFSARAADSDTAGRAADESAIRASAKEFSAAFAHGDAEAIAAMWTENGTLSDESGRLFKGRKAIASAEPTPITS